MNKESGTAVPVASVFSSQILQLIQVNLLYKWNMSYPCSWFMTFFITAYINQDNEGQQIDSWDLRDAVFPTVLMDGLNYLRTSGLLCDVVLITGDSEHSAQRVVLAAVSPYFRSLVLGNLV